MKSVLFILILATFFCCSDDHEPVVETACKMSAKLDNQVTCYEGSRYQIAYASVAGEPSFFSISTPHILNRDNGYYQIIIETTEFAGPGTYTVRSYDGGSERSTYGYFFNVNTEDKDVKEYNSVSVTLVVESVKRIEGTTNGYAKGTFTMTAKDDQGNEVTLEGSFSELRGMGWWD